MSAHTTKVTDPGSAGAASRRPDRVRRWTAHWRALPDFVIVGAQRAGTTSLFRWLAQHPRVAEPLVKEVHFFDKDEHWARGEAWYRAHFVLRSRLAPGALTFEATPDYLYRAQAAARMAEVLPGARLIALLRDPVERAHSNFKNALSKGTVRGTFEEELEREWRLLETEGATSSRTARPFLRRGLYADQLERLYACFPRERVLVLASEETFAEPQAACGRAFDFLGLDPHTLAGARAYNGSPARGLAPATRARLAEFFAPHNRRLEELVGRSFGWD